MASLLPSILKLDFEAALPDHAIVAANKETVLSACRAKRLVVHTSPWIDVDSPHEQLARLSLRVSESDQFTVTQEFAFDFPFVFGVHFALRLLAFSS